MTVFELFSSIKKQLESITENPDQESFLILEHSLNLTRSQILMRFKESIAVEFVPHVNRIVTERVSGKPLAYCLKDIAFLSHQYHVMEDVLIPRPETEILVEKAIHFLNDNPHIKTVFECGVGTGIISLEIALRCPSICIKGWDVSEKAIVCAEQNKQRLNNESCTFHLGDFFEQNLLLSPETLIISNPPYIPSADILDLDDSVKKYEPHLALDGGADGLVFYKKFYDLFKLYNCPILFEIGIHQWPDIKMLFSLDDNAMQMDYAGIPRVVLVSSLS